jgi:hypothetical protein
MHFILFRSIYVGKKNAHRNLKRNLYPKKKKFKKKLIKRDIKKSKKSPVYKGKEVEYVLLYA